MDPPPFSAGLNRRDFLKAAGLGGLALAVPQSLLASGADAKRPNVILCMTDDQGWGDTGYNGHPVLKTPNLDRMAAEGIRFDRFYAGSAVCSPTRGSCLTGRNPQRYGIFWANVGHVPKEEITLAEALKTRGYMTGHFGKWHLGTLTKTVQDGRRGGRQNQHYAPPWEHGFDVCFSTEIAVPTWDPMKDHRIPSRYWTGEGRPAAENLAGDDSRVIMDRVIPFVRYAARARKPFFAVVWFHSPHSPVRAGEEYRKMYADQDENKQHYYGCITAMDEQVGRLRAKLKDLGVAENTMLWFCSDNGPAGAGGGTAQRPGRRQQGSAGPFRGRKGSLYEGGIRVPGLLVWPEKITRPRAVEAPCCTSDYFPTVLDVLGFRMAGRLEPVDGISLLGVIEGKMSDRPMPVAFELRNQVSLIDNRYKIYSRDNGKTFELYDLIADPSEQKDLAAAEPGVLERMAAALGRWRASCKKSLVGEDYGG